MSENIDVTIENQEINIIIEGGVSSVESDPIFIASPAYGIEVADIASWDTAYLWGDHASAGYALSSSLGDLAFLDTISSSYITDFSSESQAIGDARYLKLDASNDPLAGTLEIRTTSTQLILAYDGANSSTISTSSTGALTVVPKAGQNFNISLSTTGDFAVNTNQLYVDTSTGNVGIGTTAPSFNLHLGSGSSYVLSYPQGSSITPQLGVSVTSGSAAIGAMVNDGTNNRRVGLFVDQTNALAGITTSASTGQPNFVFNIGGSESMRITSSGNVGIGTTSPSTKLHVYGSSPEIRAETSSSGDGNISIKNTNQQWNWHLKGSDSDLYAYDVTSGTFPFVIQNSTGNVGIGTTAPTNILSFGGNSTRTIWLERHTTANTAGNSLTIQAGSATITATDKNGGDLILKSGIATGTGYSSVKIQAPTAGSTGTSDASFATLLELGNNKIGLYGVTPVLRATTSIAEIAFVENSGGAVVNVDSTFGGYTVQQVVQSLVSVGILA